MAQEAIGKYPRTLKYTLILEEYDEDVTGVKWTDLPLLISQDVFHNYHCRKVRVEMTDETWKQAQDMGALCDDQKNSEERQ